MEGNIKALKPNVELPLKFQGYTRNFKQEEGRVKNMKFFLWFALLIFIGISLYIYFNSKLGYFAILAGIGLTVLIAFLIAIVKIVIFGMKEGCKECGEPMDEYKHPLTTKDVSLPRAKLFYLPNQEVYAIETFLNQEIVKALGRAIDVWRYCPHCKLCSLFQADTIDMKNILCHCERTETRGVLKINKAKELLLGNPSLANDSKQLKALIKKEFE